MIKAKIINNIEVKPIKLKEIDDRPVLGADIYPDCDINIALIASTNGGKTTAIKQILDEYAHPDTKIIAFVPTIYNDVNWGAIKEWAEENGIEFIAHISIKEGGVNLLKEYVAQLTEEAKEREAEKKRKKELCLKGIEKKISCVFPKEEDDEHEDGDSEFKYSKYIFIFDDLSDEIKSPSFGVLLKSARHFLIKTITSTQDFKDIRPTNRDQIRLWLLFRGFNEERLKTTYESLKPSMTYEKFRDLYYYCTHGKYNFMYFAPRTGEVRKNFNQILYD